MTTATVTQRSVAAAAVGEQIDARRRALIAIGWRRGLRLPELEIATGAATECGIDQEGEISWRASTMTW